MKKISFLCMFSVFILSGSELVLGSSQAPNSPNQTGPVEPKKKPWTKNRAVKGVVEEKLMGCCSDEEKATYISLLFSITPDMEDSDNKRVYEVFLAKVKKAWDVLKVVQRVCSEASAKLSAWAASSPMVISADGRAQPNFKESLELATFQTYQNVFTSISRKINGDPFKLFVKKDQTSGNYALIDFSSISQGLSNETLNNKLTEYLAECGLGGKVASSILSESRSTRVAAYLKVLILIFGQYRRLIDAVRNGSTEDEINSVKGEVQRYLGELRTIELHPLKCTMKIVGERPELTIESRENVSIAPEPKEEGETVNEEEIVTPPQTPEPEPESIPEKEEIEKKKLNMYKFMLYGAAQLVMFYDSFREPTKARYANLLEEILLNLKQTPKTIAEGGKPISERENQYVSEGLDDTLDAIFRRLEECAAPRKGFETRVRNAIASVSQRCIPMKISRPSDTGEGYLATWDKIARIGTRSYYEYKAASTENIKKLEGQIATIRNGYASKKVLTGIELNNTNKKLIKLQDQLNILIRMISFGKFSKGLARGINYYFSATNSTFVNGTQNFSERWVSNVGPNAQLDPRHKEIDKLFKNKNGKDLVFSSVVDMVALLDYSVQMLLEFGRSFFALPRVDILLQKTPPPSKGRTVSGSGTPRQSLTPQPEVQPQLPGAPNKQRDTSKVASRKPASPTAAKINQNGESSSSTTGSSPTETPPNSPKTLKIRINSIRT